MAAQPLTYSEKSYCAHCHVFFITTLIVSTLPSSPPIPISHPNPRKWLEQIEICPVCMHLLEKEPDSNEPSTLQCSH